MVHAGLPYLWRLRSASYWNRCVFSAAISYWSTLVITHTQQPLFGSYNDRVRSENATLEKQKNVSDEERANRRRDEIDFSKHQKDIDEFKLKLIYERMREEEAKSNVWVCILCGVSLVKSDLIPSELIIRFNKWIQLIDYYQGEDLAYLNAKGTIVQAAIIKKGERRQNALR